MTKAQLEEENRNLKLLLEQIAYRVSNEYYSMIRDEQLAAGSGYDEARTNAYCKILGSVSFFASPDEDGEYSKVYPKR